MSSWKKEQNLTIEDQFSLDIPPIIHFTSSVNWGGNNLLFNKHYNLLLIFKHNGGT